jgi:AbrB family looped-hinge helix DNA binding protein
MDTTQDPIETEQGEIRPRTRTYRVRIDPAGRVVIPAELRTGLNVMDGEVLLVREDDGGIRIETFPRALRHARELLARYAGAIRSDNEVTNEAPHE